MSKLEVWVGVRGSEVRAATTLKYLCEGLGVSHEVVRREIGDVNLKVVGSRVHSKLEVEGWVIQRVEVAKVKGRGNDWIKGYRAGGKLGEE